MQYLLAGKGLGKRSVGPPFLRAQEWIAEYVSEASSGGPPADPFMPGPFLLGKGKKIGVGGPVLLIQEFVGSVTGIDLVQSITDALGFLDNRTVSQGFNQTVSEALGLLDARTVDFGFGRVVSDVLGLVDSRVLGRTVVLVEALGLLDTRTISQGWGRVIAEALGLVDSRTVSLGFAQTVGDALGMVDSRVSASTFARIVSDIMGLLDGLSRVSGHERTIVELAGLLDALLKKYDQPSAPAPMNAVPFSDPMFSDLAARREEFYGRR